MLFGAKVRFLGTEQKTSKKTGNIYNQIMVMQGVESLTVLTDVDVVELAELGFGEEYVANFEFNIKYSQLKVIGIK